jgi:long-chain fatty acid transport protein
MNLQGAESLSLIPDSAESLGIAGARYANLADATVIRVAPASMVDAARPVLQINTGIWHGDVKFGSVTGAHLEHNEPWVYPGSVYAILPAIPGSLAFGVGISTPYALDSSYGKNNALRYLVPYEFSLRTMSITPAVSWRISQSVTAGLGLDIMQGILGIHQIVPLGSFDGKFHYDATGWGISSYGSLRWDITEHQRIALVGRLPMRVKMDGTFKADGVVSGLPAGFDNHSTFSSEMTFPGSIALGYGIDVTDRLTLGLDFKWSANSSHDDIPLNTGNSNSLLPTKSIPLKWQNSIDIGTGASFRLSDAWIARAGYLFSENSRPSSTTMPSIPAYDRHLFSLGFGWKRKSNSVDLTYGFIYDPSRTVSNTDSTAFNGRYRQQWHVVMLSIGHKF